MLPEFSSSNPPIVYLLDQARSVAFGVNWLADAHKNKSDNAQHIGFEVIVDSPATVDAIETLKDIEQSMQ